MTTLANSTAVTSRFTRRLGAALRVCTLGAVGGFLEACVLYLLDPALMEGFRLASVALTVKGVLIAGFVGLLSLWETRSARAAMVAGALLGAAPILLPLVLAGPPPQPERFMVWSMVLLDCALGAVLARAFLPRPSGVPSRWTRAASLIVGRYALVFAGSVLLVAGLAAGYQRWQERRVYNLADALAGGDASVARTAAQRAGGNQRVLEILVHRLNDAGASDNARIAAAKAIGFLAPDADAAIPFLVRALGSWPQPATDSIVDSLAAFGDKAVPALKDALATGNQLRQVNAARTLGLIGRSSPSAISTLAGSLSSPQDTYVRGIVIDVLGSLGAKAVPVLIASLDSAPAAARATAAQALAKVGAPARTATPQLIAALRDENIEVRVAAQHALGEIRDERAVDALLNTIRTPGTSYRERVAVVDALGKMGASAVPALTGALPAQGADYRRDVIAALGRIGAPSAEATPSIAALLRGKDRETRLVAMTALGNIGDPRAIAPLIASFDDSPYYNSSDRFTAAQAVAKFGAASVPALMRALASDDVARDTAAYALGLIGPPARDAVPALTRILRDETASTLSPTAEAMPWRHRDVGSTAIDALVKIGFDRPESHVPVLVRAMERESLEKSAIDALGAIGPPAREAVPLLLNRLWVDNLATYAEAALRNIDVQTSAQIMNEKAAYAKLATAVTSIRLLAPRDAARLQPSSSVRLRWAIDGRQPGLKYCSTVYVDKGSGPLDSHFEYLTQVGEATYYDEYVYDFEWAVVTTVCRDARASCNSERVRPCVGRAFTSRVHRIISLP